MKYFILLTLVFFGACSDGDEVGTVESDNSIKVLSIKTGDAKSIGVLSEKNKIEGPTFIISGINDDKERLPVVGFNENGDFTPVDIIVEGMKDDSISIDRIVPINADLGFAKIDSRNYVFNRGDGKAFVFEDLPSDKENAIFKAMKGDSPIRYYGGYYYYIDSNGDLSRGKVENGGIVGKEVFRDDVDDVLFQSELKRLSEIGPVTGLVGLFDINENGLLMVRVGSSNQSLKYHFFDLNGVLNSGEKFILSGDGYNNGNVFLRRKTNNVFHSRNDLELKEFVFYPDRVEEVDVRNTRYFSIKDLDYKFSLYKENCQPIPQSSGKEGFFCYISEDRWFEEKGATLFSSGRRRVGFGLSGLFFNHDDLIVNIQLSSYLIWRHSSVCEFYSNCGSLEVNNKTFFGFYNIDAIDFWGDYFIACGEEYKENTEELLGKRCIVYDVYSQTLTEDLVEIVDNNTFIVDHVIFKENGDALFYGSDFGDENKKFKVSVYNSGTWGPLQEVTMNLGQYIEKILRF
jgi:hypothetical protein